MPALRRGLRPPSLLHACGARTARSGISFYGFVIKCDDCHNSCYIIKHTAARIEPEAGVTRRLLVELKRPPHLSRRNAQRATRNAQRADPVWRTIFPNSEATFYSGAGPEIRTKMSEAEKKSSKHPVKTIELLKQQTLLRNVADDVIAWISDRIQYRRYNRRDFVVQKGEAGSSLLMLMSGRLQVIALSEDGREVGLSFVEPGDYFGELSIIDGGPRSASIMAATDSVVGFLPKSAAQSLFYQNPTVVEALLQRLCRTIRQASSYRSMLGLTSAYARVYSVLHASMKKKTPGNPAAIENLPNQQAIAIMANVSRETVSRAIRSLLDAQIVERERRRLVVRDPATLAKLAKGEAGVLAGKLSAE